MRGSSPRMTTERGWPDNSHQQIDQMRDQRDVGWRHGIAAQLVGADPGEGLAFASRYHAFPAPADVERHQQVERLVSVACEGQRRQARLGYSDAELLVELANEALLRPFAGLELAA